MPNDYIHPSIKAPLLPVVNQLLEDLRYMGILKKYGSFCLFISSLVRDILRQQGFHAEITSCLVRIENQQQHFLLGDKKYAAPDQLATHVICIIDDSVLIDLGLGNVHKTFDPNFFQAIVLPFQGQAEVFSYARFGEDHQMFYLREPQIVPLDEHLATQQPLLDNTLMEYQRYCKNRFRFSLARALRSLGAQQRRPSQPLTRSFDDTWCH